MFVNLRETFTTFGKGGQSHLLAEQAVDDLAPDANRFSTANKFRRKAVTVMRTFPAVAICLGTQFEPDLDPTQHIFETLKGGVLPRRTF